jgi:class 3 adenylate cyclase
MRRLLIRLLQIGADPTDDEDLRLRKVLLLGAVLMVVPAAGLWGVIYWLFGEPVAAAIPWTYLVIAAISVTWFAVTRNYPVFAATQFVTYIILPFALMWVLGGFVSGSAVGLWAWIAPLGARIMGHRRAAAALFVVFAAGFVLTAFLRPMLVADNNLPELVVVGFFVLNVVAVGGITLILLDASEGGREGSRASMRGIVRRYFSPAVVEMILADPRRQELGGDVADVTILFADLGGYTTYAGSRKPHEVLELLNVVFGAAMPPVLAEGGTPVQMPGDAVMAIFGAPHPQPDHAARAARAALAIQARGRELAEQHPAWPRFRIGLNSGEALVGNIGSDEFRSFTAIGDTTNMAQRFQTLAQPGQIVVGPMTAELLGGQAEMASLGDVTVKGKIDPVAPWTLLAVREG